MFLKLLETIRNNGVQIRPGSIIDTAALDISDASADVLVRRGSAEYYTGAMALASVALPAVVTDPAGAPAPDADADAVAADEPTADADDPEPEPQADPEPEPDPTPGVVRDETLKADGSKRRR